MRRAAGLDYDRRHSARGARTLLLLSVTGGYGARVIYFGRMMVRNLKLFVVAAALLPSLAACGTHSGDMAAGSTQMAAYSEPSRTVPDYSPRGATSLLSIGIGIF